MIIQTSIFSIVSLVGYFVHHVLLIAPFATIALSGLIIIAHGLETALEKETIDTFTSSLYH